jgi:hypothetical protein
MLALPCATSTGHYLTKMPLDGLITTTYALNVDMHLTHTIGYALEGILRRVGAWISRHGSPACVKLVNI